MKMVSSICWQQLTIAEFPTLIQPSATPSVTSFQSFLS